MTIDEAIDDFKKMAENAINDIIDGDNLEPQEKHYNEQLELYAKEKEQLAEWLEELKEYQEISKKNPFLVDMIKHDKIVRNKAIDEAMAASAKAICIGCGYLEETKCKYKGGNCGVSKPMLETVMKALEQLKAGGEHVKERELE